VCVYPLSHQVAGKYLTIFPPAPDIYQPDGENPHEPAGQSAHYPDAVNEQLDRLMPQEISGTNEQDQNQEYEQEQAIG